MLRSSSQKKIGIFKNSVLLIFEVGASVILSSLKTDIHQPSTNLYAGGGVFRP